VDDGWATRGRPGRGGATGHRLRAASWFPADAAIAKRLRRGEDGVELVDAAAA